MKKILLFIVLLTFCCNNSYTQTYISKEKLSFLDTINYSVLEKSKKEKLLLFFKKVKSLKNDTLILNKLDSITEHISEDQVWYPINKFIKEQSEELIKLKGVNSKTKKNFYSHYASSLNNEGYYYYFKGNLNKAAFYFKASAPYFRKIGHKNGLASIYNNLASIYDDQGNVIASLHYYFKSLKIKDELKDSSSIGNSLNNISLVYQKQGEYNQALKYAYKALTIRKTINDSFQIANSYHNIALIQGELKNFDYAIYQYNKSIKIRKAINDVRGLGNVYNNLGYIYLEYKKDLFLAEKYLMESYNIRKKIDDSYLNSEILNNLALLEFYKNNYSLSEKYGLQSFEIAQKNAYLVIEQRATAHLYSLYKKQSKWQMALKMNERANQINEILKNEKNKKEIYKKQFAYQYTKQRELDQIENDKKLLIAKQKQIYQKYISIIFGVSLFLLSILIFFLYKRFKQNVRQKQIIEKQKELVEQKNIEITSSITYAKRIQSAIMPPEEIFKTNFPNSFIFYLPKDIVAGDFYWMIENDESIFIAVADCTGHGVPGALVSVVCHNALNRSVREFGLTDPGNILDKTRDLVIQEFQKSDNEVKDGMDISLVVFHKKSDINKDNQTFHQTILWAGANNPLWVLRNSSISTLTKELFEIKPDKQPIGKYIHSRPFTTHKINLEKGDEIYLFTDGFQDQFGGPDSLKFRTGR
ncbi:MAG: tetratricopeptide repeat protein [Flavobacteriia bacterium]|nr:tetratricopeptide repeat protein [Flavobacteriia bacterium]